MSRAARAFALVHSSRFHVTMMGVWALLALPTLLVWRDSITWVAFMSLYANFVGHWSAQQAVLAEKANSAPQSIRTLRMDLGRAKLALRALLRDNGWASGNALVRRASCPWCGSGVVTTRKTVDQIQHVSDCPLPMAQSILASLDEPEVNRS